MEVDFNIFLSKGNVSADTPVFCSGHGFSRRIVRWVVEHAPVCLKFAVPTFLVARWVPSPLTVFYHPPSRPVKGAVSGTATTTLGEEFPLHREIHNMVLSSTHNYTFGRAKHV